MLRTHTRKKPLSLMIRASGLNPALIMLSPFSNMSISQFVQNNLASRPDACRLASSPSDVAGLFTVAATLSVDFKYID